MDRFASNGDEFSPPETGKATDRSRSSRRLKRGKTKLVALGVAATVAAGGFAAFQISSASAAEVSVSHTETVPVKIPGPLCSEITPGTAPCFATEEDRQIEMENKAKQDANVFGSPTVCRPPFGQPNPTRGDMGTATVDKFSADQWRVTMIYHCLAGDSGPTPSQQPGA
jgi:hypothetical protein